MGNKRPVLNYRYTILAFDIDALPRRFQEYYLEFSRRNQRHIGRGGDELSSPNDAPRFTLVDYADGLNISLVPTVLKPSFLGQSDIPELLDEEFERAARSIVN